MTEFEGFNAWFREYIRHLCIDENKRAITDEDLNAAWPLYYNRMQSCVPQYDLAQVANDLRPFYKKIDIFARPFSCLCRRWFQHDKEFGYVCYQFNGTSGKKKSVLQKSGRYSQFDADSRHIYLQLAAMTIEEMDRWLRYRFVRNLNDVGGIRKTTEKWRDRAKQTQEQQAAAEQFLQRIDYVAGIVAREA